MVSVVPKIISLGIRQLAMENELGITGDILLQQTLNIQIIHNFKDNEKELGSSPMSLS